jgi:type IV secretion system protein VirB6
MIMGIGLSVGTYQSQIIPVVNDVFFSLGKIVSLKGSNNCNFSASQVFQMIDCNESHSMAFTKAFWTSLKNGGAWAFAQSILVAFYATILTLGISLYYLVIAVEILYSYLALQLILGVGPLFICALAFEPTKKYFDGWLSKVIYLCIFSMLCYAFMGMTVSILESILIEALPGAMMQDADALSLADSAGTDLMLLVPQLVLVFLMLGWVGTRISGIAGTLANSAPSGSSMAAFIGGMITRNILNRGGAPKSPNVTNKGGSITNGTPSAQSRSERLGQNLGRIAARGRDMVRKSNG